MADQIFLVNSSSFQDVKISSSLRAGTGIIVDFTQASLVTGSFSGRGDALTNITASHIDPATNITASYAMLAETASFASNVVTTPPASASWASSSISASYAISASFVDTLAYDNLVLGFEFKFNNNTSAGDPGNGKFRYNNASSQSITDIYVSSTTNNGLDIGGIVRSLHSGSYQLYIQQKSDSSKASIFQVSGEVADSSSWFSVPVTHLSTATGGLPSNNQLCVFFVINKNSIVPGQTYPVTASWANNATTASFASNVTTAPPASASWASESLSSSYINPGATFQIISGSNGVPPAFIDVYDIPTGSYIPSYKEGRMWYDGQYHNMDYYTEDSGFRCQLGKELIIGVHNPYTTSLARLSVVYVSGSTGIRPDVYLALADGSGTKSKIIGVVRSDIASGSTGYMLTRGVMHRSNMSGYDVGTSLWLSSTTPGGLTTTRPGQPYEDVLVGYCSEAGATGSFVCAIQEYPQPANAYAGMTTFPTIADALNSASADFTHSLYIGAGTVNLFTDPTGFGTVNNYPLLPVTLSVPAGGSVLYAYAFLDGTTASYSITSDLSSLNQTTKVPVAIVYRADVDAHWVENNEEGLALANKLNQRLISTERFTRESGLSLGVTGSRYITVTAGALWIGATRFTEQPFDSRLTGSDFQSGSFDETHFAYHSASTWVTPVVVDGTYNNAYYDNGTNLIPLSSGSYVLNYVFRVFGENNNYDEDIFYLASNTQYNSIQEAQADVLPADVPVVLTDIGLLLGRIIVQSGSNTAALVESAFAATFGTSIINNHNNLAGLDGGGGGRYYHLSTTDYTGNGTGTIVRSAGATLTTATITGSLQGTSSWASNATTAITANTASSLNFTVISASHADTASWAINAINGGTTLVTGSTYPITASWATTANTANAISFVPNNALSASYVSASAKITTADTASYILASNVSGKVSTTTTADTASYVAAANIAGTITATQAPYAVSSSWISASAFITTAQTASYVTGGNVSGTVGSATNATFATSASWISASAKITTADTASYVLASNISGKVSTATTADTASYVLASNVSGKVSTATTADTASYVAAANIAGTVTNATYASSASWASSSVSTSYAATANTFNTTATIANVNYSLVFVTNSGSSQTPFVDSGSVPLAYNASTHNIIGANLTGTSSWASNAITASYISTSFSRGGTIYDPLGIAGTAATQQSIIIWRAPFTCTVTNVWGQRVGGTSALVNALRTTTSGTISGSIAASNINLNTASVWMAASSLNTASSSFAAGDELDILLVSCSANPTQIAVQVDFIK